MQIAPTPKDTILREGTAELYRFRRPSDRPAASRIPLLIVPSLINRWYILDLRPGFSVCEALVPSLDTYLLDWGVPRDEDRYLEWNGVLRRLARAVRKVKRETGAPRVALLGYCMGGTLAGIYSALHPENVAALVNLAGPFDFSEAGRLGHMTDPRWFDAATIAAAGNLMPEQMQSGFNLLRPTLSLGKWVNFFGQAHDPEAREAFFALEQWSGDNTPFPAAAYVTYIQELYQQNLLVKGEHYALGRRVDLGAIQCPVLSVVASHDGICPRAAATGLNAHVGSKDTTVLEIKGGHVGAVVGPKAAATLYPALAAWFTARTRLVAA